MDQPERIIRGMTMAGLDFNQDSASEIDCDGGVAGLRFGFITRKPNIRNLTVEMLDVLGEKFFGIQWEPLENSLTVYYESEPFEQDE